jgi:hypothetical protein
VQLDPDARVMPEAGGVMRFSGNRLDLTVPNTVQADLAQHRHSHSELRRRHRAEEAANIDCACMRTSRRDFLRARDFERIAADVALTCEGLTRTYA